MHTEIRDLVERYLPGELKCEDMPLHAKLLIGWLVEHESLLPARASEDLSRIVDHLVG